MAPRCVGVTFELFLLLVNKFLLLVGCPSNLADGFVVDE
jgi:hypothetical protein